MEDISFFTEKEKAELFALYKRLIRSAGESITKDDTRKLKKYLIHAAQCNSLRRNNFGMNPVIRDLQTAVVVADEIGMKGSCLIGIMLHEIVKITYYLLQLSAVSLEKMFRVLLQDW